MLFDLTSRALGEGMAEALQTEKLEVIIGRSGIERLARARVMVLGVGGVGSNCVEALARGGVGNLVIVDRDTVAASNINRQAIAFHSTIGQRKVDVMEHMVHDINPAAHVETHGDFLRAETLPAFLEPYRGSIDWVVDAIDTVSAKLALAAYADSTGLPLVSSMGSLFQVDRSKIIGLVIQAEQLNHIRNERLKNMGVSSSANYASPERIFEEMEYALGIMKKLACPIIDVTNKAVEETASKILEIYYGRVNHVQ